MKDESKAQKAIERQPRRETTHSRSILAGAAERAEKQRKHGEHRGQWAGGQELVRRSTRTSFVVRRESRDKNRPSSTKCRWCTTSATVDMLGNIAIGIEGEYLNNICPSLSANMTMCLTDILWILRCLLPRCCASDFCSPSSYSGLIHCPGVSRTLSSSSSTSSTSASTI